MALHRKHDMPTVEKISIVKIVRDYDEKVGGYWFSDNTMRVFDTKLPNVALKGAAGTLFVTRERNARGNGFGFTIREAKEDGDIDTVGTFLGYPTEAKAWSAVLDMHWYAEQAAHHEEV